MKLKQKTITDEELLIFGDYLFEDKENNLTIIIEFNNYLKKVIDIYTKFSPYKTELNNLYSI